MVMEVTPAPIVVLVVVPAELKEYVAAYAVSGDCGNAKEKTLFSMRICGHPENIHAKMSMTTAVFLRTRDA
jgi:hypothetical protein